MERPSTYQRTAVLIGMEVGLRCRPISDCFVTERLLNIDRGMMQA